MSTNLVNFPAVTSLTNIHIYMYIYIYMHAIRRGSSTRPVVFSAYSCVCVSVSPWKCGTWCLLPSDQPPGIRMSGCSFTAQKFIGSAVDRQRAQSINPTVRANPHTYKHSPHTHTHSEDYQALNVCTTSPSSTALLFAVRPELSACLRQPHCWRPTTIALAAAAAVAVLLVPGWIGGCDGNDSGAAATLPRGTRTAHQADGRRACHQKSVGEFRESVRVFRKYPDFVIESFVFTIS